MRRKTDLGGALLLLARVLDADHEIVVLLVILCAAQLLAPAPMLLSIATKRRLPAPSPRARSLFASGFVALVVLASVIVAALH